MTWTYTLSTLETVQKDQVRLRVGDVDTTEQLVQDEEINLALSQRNSVIGASAMIAMIIAAKFSRLSDTSTGDTKYTFSQKAESYRKLAETLEAQDDQFGGATPYASGTLVSDMAAAESNSDRVPNAFKVGMDDYPAPVPNGPWGYWP